MLSDPPASDGEWYAFEGGANIGTVGPEGGHTLRDEEHAAGMRITLERYNLAAFGITCGIYGCFVHTAYAASESEASAKYDAMKLRLVGLIDMGDEFYDELSNFSDQF